MAFRQFQIQPMHFQPMHFQPVKFQPMQFQPMQFQPLTISAYRTFNLLHIQPTLTSQAAACDGIRITASTVRQETRKVELENQEKLICYQIMKS